MALGTEFTKSMKNTHTIYMPQMIHYHNRLLQAAFKYGGYNLDIVPEHKEYSKGTLSSINRDYCTCAIGIVGNILTFIENHECDLETCAFLEPQAGGACRAGNYYNLIIQCLKRTGYSKIPVLSLNAHGTESHPGFNINAKMLFGAVAAVCYSDLLMTLYQQTFPYELNKGQTKALHEKWLEDLYSDISQGKNIFHRKKLYQKIVSDFASIPVDRSINKRKVGIVGEIYIKFSPVGNCHLEDFLSEHDCEYRQGGFVNYCIYVVYSEMENNKLLGKNKVILRGYQAVIDYLCKLQAEISDALKSNGFLSDSNFYELKEFSEKILDDRYNIGDGWLMTAEVIDLIKQGYEKILIVHPFGCLVSHVGGRGVIKKINESYPGAKVSSIEFDFDQSNTLRENRILLAIN